MNRKRAIEVIEKIQEMKAILSSDGHGGVAYWLGKGRHQLATTDRISRRGKRPDKFSLQGAFDYCIGRWYEHGDIMRIFQRVDLDVWNANGRPSNDKLVDVCDKVVAELEKHL